MIVDNLGDLKEYCKINNRVCPQPQLWNELWNNLKNKKQIAGKWQPSLPLILAAWWDTPILLKQLRLMEHLEWADNNEQLQEIANFLTNLCEDQWYHIND